MTIAIPARGEAVTTPSRPEWTPPVAEAAAHPPPPFAGRLLPCWCGRTVIWLETTTGSWIAVEPAVALGRGIVTVTASGLARVLNRPHPTGLALHAPRCPAALPDTSSTERIGPTALTALTPTSYICAACRLPLVLALLESGESSHPTCRPGAALLRRPEPATLESPAQHHRSRHAS